MAYHIYSYIFSPRVLIHVLEMSDYFKEFPLSSCVHTKFQTYSLFFMSYLASPNKGQVDDLQRWKKNTEKTRSQKKQNKQQNIRKICCWNEKPSRVVNQKKTRSRPGFSDNISYLSLIHIQMCIRDRFKAISIVYFLSNCMKFHTFLCHTMNAEHNTKSMSMQNSMLTTITNI